MCQASANHLLKQYNANGSNNANADNEHGTDHALMQKLKALQDDNKRLQAQLQKCNANGGMAETASDLQYKNYLQEIDILKKKLGT